MTAAVAPVAAPAAATTAPVADGTAAATAATAPKVETAAVKAERIRLKYKAAGKEQEVDKSHDELARDLQVLEGLKGERGSFMKERDAFNSDRDAFLKDPRGYLKKAGLSLSELAKAEAAEAAELAAMSPEARRIRELEEQVATHERTSKETAETQKVAASRAAHQKLVSETAQAFDAAIKLSGLPRSGALLKTFAEVQEMAVHAGEPPLSPEQLVTAAERLTVSRLGETLKHAVANEGWRQRNAQPLAELAKLVMPSLDGKPLLDWLGKDLVTKVAKAALADMRNASRPIVQEPPRPDAPPQQPQRREPQRSEWDFMDRATG